jgi:hypothetical protein
MQTVLGTAGGPAGEATTERAGGSGARSRAQARRALSRSKSGERDRFAGMGRQTGDRPGTVGGCRRHPPEL